LIDITFILLTLIPKPINNINIIKLAPYPYCYLL